MEIQIKNSRFNEMAEHISCSQIAEKKCASKSFTVQNKQVVITGGVGTGKGVGWGKLWGYEIVPLNQYKGTLKPLNYMEHWLEVDEKNRPRSYSGMKIKCEGKLVVFVGEQIEFVPTKEEIQLDLW